MKFLRVAVVCVFAAVLAAEAATNVVPVCDETALRSALEAGDIVTFDCDGLILLTSPLTISRDVVIDGRARAVTISGNDRVRVFSVVAGVTVTVMNIAISGGKGTNGAGIFNEGHLTLLQCDLSLHRVAGRPGLLESPGMNASGGAIHNSGTLIVSNCAFFRNTATGGMGGAGFFAGNAGHAFGGAIYNSGDAAVVASTFAENIAAGGAGGSGDTTDEFGEGGNGGSGGNAAGGAIYNLGNISVMRTTLMNNAAMAGVGGDGGPGVYAGPGGNGGSGAGGAINVGGGQAGLTNCTFYQNAVSGGSGGLGGDGFTGGGFGGEGGHGRLGFGGGVYASGGASFVVHSTFSTNRASGGLGGAGGVGTAGAGSSGARGANGLALGGAVGRLGGGLRLERSIVAASVSAGNISGSIIDGGYNISSDASYPLAAPGGSTNTSPRLGPLADNGGPTPTLALLSGSPAIDAIPATGCLEIDQREAARPQGTNCDIGAFEGGVAYPTASLEFRPLSINPGEPAVLEITVHNPNTSELSDVTFTNVLPPELSVTLAATNSGVCGGTLVALGNVVALAGGSLSGTQSCTIAMSVTSLIPGLHTNRLNQIRTLQAGGGPVAAVAALQVTGAPLVSTLPAENLTLTAATVRATVNPRGATASAWFEYGQTTNYGSQTSPLALGSGTVPVSISSSMTGLVSGATYHYRAVAQNAAGITYGDDRTLSPLSPALYALRLDGANDFIASPDLRPSFSNETMTVEFWFRPFAAGVLIDERGQAPPAGGGWHISLLEILDTGEVRARVNGVPMLSFGIATFGHWHHVALRYDTSSLELSGVLNGVPSGKSVGDRAAPWESGAGFFLGFGLADDVHMGSGRHLAADLDEIRIWNTARSDVEIAANRYARLTGPEFGLVAYWRCDEGAGVFANDTANQYSALLYNGVQWISSEVPLQIALPPFAATLPAIQVTTNAATLHGSVSTRGEDTIAFFEFGRTINYGSVTPIRLVPGAAAEVRITESLSNLFSGAQYHYRLVASNALGVSIGENRSFTLPTAALYAVQLDGVNDFISTPNLNSSFSTETITIEFWFKASAAGVLIDERGQTPPAGGWQLTWMEISSSGEVRARVNNLSQISIGTARLDRWHHVALRYDKAALTLSGFLDGIKSPDVASGDRAAPAESGASFFLCFGLADNINMGNGAQFRGQLDDIRIWNVARTDQQIAQNYARRLSLPALGLVAYWPFDEQDLLDARDVTGNGNHGTLSGRPLIVPSGLPIGLPQIRDVSVTNITTSSALVRGTIHPNSLPASYFLEWGTTTDYSNATPIQAISNNLSADHTFAVSLTGLEPARPYHVRVAASNENGFHLSPDILFHTAGEASGPAIQLDGVGDYIMSPDLQRFFPSETVTIEVWFRPVAPGVIVDERGQNPPTGSWQTTLAELLPSGDVVVRVHQVPAINLGRAALGQWHHLALRYNKAAMTLAGLLDGVQTASVTTGDRAAPWEFAQGQFFAFGLTDPVNMGSGAYFKGQMDEIRIWNVARTASEITSRMNYRLIGNESGLVAYWRCDEGSGATLQDSTVNNNDAVLANSGTWVVSGAPLNVLYVSTGDAINVTDTSAVLSGIAVPNAAPATAYFEWGPTPELTNRTAVLQISPLPATQTITQRLDNLKPASVYYFRLVIVPDGRAAREGVVKSFETAGNASGGGILLDGQNDFIYSRDLTTFISNETFTVEVWFKALSPGVIIDERGQAPPGSAYQLSLVEVLGTGEVRARVNGPPAVSLGQIQFGSWHHVALRYDKLSLSLVGFLDGTNSLVATGDRRAPWEPELQWHLGFGLGDSANLGSGAYFRGELDEIRIWKVARSDLDLRTHQFRALTGTENGLIAYWNLDDNTGGNVVLDSSGHSNHGTLVNGPMRVASTAPITEIVPISKRADGAVLMQFLGVPWEFYDLEHSTNLLDWQMLQPLRATRTGVIEFETLPDSSQQFFRVKSVDEAP